MGKGTAQHALCCPCGRPEILALGLCASSYTMKRQDEAYFGGTGSGPRARWLPLPWLRRAWPRETLHHRPSSGARRLQARANDFTLSGLSCQGGADQDGSSGDDPTAPSAMARAASGGPGTNHVGLQRERAGNSNSAAGIRRSSKRNCEAWRVNVPELMDVVNGKALLVATEG
jgi:hypothetical protein